MSKTQWLSTFTLNAPAPSLGRTGGNDIDENMVDPGMVAFHVQAFLSIRELPDLLGMIRADCRDLSGDSLPTNEDFHAESPDLKLWRGRFSDYRDGPLAVGVFARTKRALGSSTDFTFHFTTPGWFLSVSSVGSGYTHITLRRVGGERLDPSDTPVKVTLIARVQGWNGAASKLDALTLGLVNMMRDRALALRHRTLRRSRQSAAVRLLTTGNDGGLRAEEFRMPTWRSPTWSNYSAPVREGYARIAAMVRAKDPGEGRLVVLSGPPGTGKTYLMRGLAKDLNSYRPLVVPPDVAAQVGSPAFITYLRELRREDDCPVVLFIEDADHLLRHRDHNPHGLTALSTILNVSDGMLGGVLDLRIVATVNSFESGDLDPAVMRSGRLAAHVHVDVLGGLDLARAWQGVMGKGAPPWPGPASTPLADVYRFARAAGWRQKAPGRAAASRLIPPGEPTIDAEYEET